MKEMKKNKIVLLKNNWMKIFKMIKVNKCKKYLTMRVKKIQ